MVRWERKIAWSICTEGEKPGGMDQNQLRLYVERNETMLRMWCAESLRSTIERSLPGRQAINTRNKTEIPTSTHGRRWGLIDCNKQPYYYEKAYKESNYYYTQKSTSSFCKGLSKKEKKGCFAYINKVHHSYSQVLRLCCNNLGSIKRDRSEYTHYYNSLCDHKNKRNAASRNVTGSCTHLLLNHVLILFKSLKNNIYLFVFLINLIYLICILSTALPVWGQDWKSGRSYPG